MKGRLRCLSQDCRGLPSDVWRWHVARTTHNARCAVDTTIRGHCVAGGRQKFVLVTWGPTGHRRVDLPMHTCMGSDDPGPVILFRVSMFLMWYEPRPYACSLPTARTSDPDSVHGKLRQSYEIGITSLFAPSAKKEWLEVNRAQSVLSRGVARGRGT